MSHKAVTRHELRCVCSRAPLLGVYGIDQDGMAYIHIKAHKQSRLIAEIVARGECAIHCRECLRWTRFRINDRNGPSRIERTEDPGVQTLGGQQGANLL